MQRFASLTNKVYDPAGTPLKTLVGWNVIPSLLYCNVPVPPDAAAVMPPFAAPHAASVIAAVKV